MFMTEHLGLLEALSENSKQTLFFTKHLALT